MQRAQVSLLSNGRALWLAIGVFCLTVALGVALIGMMIGRSNAPAEAAALTSLRRTAPMLMMTEAFTPLASVTLTASATPSASPTASPSPSPSSTRTATHTSTASPTSLPTRPPLTLATPRPANLTTIGYSVAGRPIEVYRFGSGPVERLIVAGMHGGYEWNTIALADELIAHLFAHPEMMPPDVTLFILRSLNPDGEARSRGVSGRANENGVDLNRNWPSRWKADWPRDGCWKYLHLSGGSGPASEPETFALMTFLLNHKIDALINYHSAAQGIFPGGQPPDAASLSLAEAVAAVSDYPYPGLDFNCQFTGQLIDWASERSIAALDIELTNHRDTDFEQNLAILSVFLAWRY